MRAALQVTGATDLLDLLPDGLGTVVGTGGHPLTDAQAQQVAPARLLLAHPQLAILDEATAEAGSTRATGSWSWSTAASSRAERTPT